MAIFWDSEVFWGSDILGFGYFGVRIFWGSDILGYSKLRRPEFSRGWDNVGKNLIS